MLIHTHTTYVTGVWEKVDDGVGLNQYDPLLPHARYMHTGAPLSENRFVIFGGCARYTYTHIYIPTCTFMCITSRSMKYAYYVDDLEKPVIVLLLNVCTFICVVDKH